LNINFPFGSEAEYPSDLFLYQVVCFSSDCVKDIGFDAVSRFGLLGFNSEDRVTKLCVENKHSSGLNRRTDGLDL